MSPTPIRNIPVNNDLPINSIHVISQHWGLILALLAFIIWNALLIFAHLKKNTGFQYTDLELTALAMGGWPLPALLFSFIILFLSAFIPAGFILVIAAVIILSSGWFAVRAVWGKHFSMGACACFDLSLVRISPSGLCGKSAHAALL
ncbi:hypothetical protein [Candidatus Villigracilis affinis]|uniref:hypothetical protein n=1 Tax=Candidatus Villigracilis affinis TaxID=3140682 RepID=UPI001D714DC2|nr:hypothetical protein [Anaerolineales bacterium]